VEASWGVQGWGGVLQVPLWSNSRMDLKAEAFCATVPVFLVVAGLTYSAVKQKLK
jgi:hypothetical protein